jgi:hypothetical protein
MQILDTAAPIETIPADVLVLFQPANEPAPRGRLGRVDWLLLSGLSRLTVREKFAAERGASVLLSSGGKFAADWVLVIGLGQRAEMTMTALYRLSYQAAETVLRLRRPRIAVELPLRAFPAEPPERIRLAFLEGFLAELQRGWPEADFTVSVLAAPGAAPVPASGREAETSAAPRQVPPPTAKPKPARKHRRR